ncbi:MAG: M48 family metalloprotease [Sphingorhabdus sp.]
MRKLLIAALLAGQVLAPMANAEKPQPLAIGELPKEKDERGLWMQADEDERTIKASNFVIRDPALNAYVRDVFCKTVGQEECAPVRIYIVRTAYFNASMSPNGMMIIWSGLLLRTRNEAQLAAVLGHEYTHFRNRHSLQLFRSVKGNANVAAIFGMFGLVGSLAQLAILSNIFTFSREMERDADAGSIPMLAAAGYDPSEASKIWGQIRDEADATAAARGTKSRKDKNGGMFATHPGSAERMATMAEMAEKSRTATSSNTREAEYRQALQPFWADFIDDQIKLNDFGATELLLGQLASGGWTPELLFARGELYRMRGKPEDLSKAAEFYRQAVADPGAPVESWRGLGLALLRNGQELEGKSALKEYLKLRPDAKDRPMIAMMAGEQI